MISNRLFAAAFAPAPVLLAGVILAGVLLAPTNAQAGPLDRENVPPALAPWVDWSLAGHEARLCPTPIARPDEHLCAWPDALNLVIGRIGGTFFQTWDLSAESTVMLPGEPRHWPQSVEVNGEPAIVIEREGLPALRLGPGSYAVSGRFVWDRQPESLKLPDDTGLLALSLRGESVTLPDLDGDGRVWFSRSAPAEATTADQGDRLDIQTLRLVTDTIPLTLQTRVVLNVTGSAREIRIGPVLPPDFIPLALSAPLPARLEADGQLRIQVRPGRWEFDLTGRAPDAVSSLARPSAGPPWPEEEVWAFQARNDLRIVNVEGVAAVDPRQTLLPQPWQQFPAYRLGSNDRMGLSEQRRGDPTPEPNRLSLQRDLWMDFNGKGYTVQDRLSGTITQSWRLTTEPVLALGQATIDGAPQFITHLDDPDRRGVEVRSGTLNLVARSRMESADGRWTNGTLAANGWMQDLQGAATTLNMAPGWRLLHANGVDQVNSSWLTRWSLFDLFLVLIASAAVGRLWGWRWGAIILVFLALSYHEQGAPQQVWLHVLAASALTRVLKDGRLAKIARLYRYASLLALAAIAVPFAVDQVRIALYPQLEFSSSVSTANTRPVDYAGLAPEPPPAPAAIQQDEAPQQRSRRESYAAATELLAPKPKLYSRRELVSIDPDAVIQTGPGLPWWRWESVSLRWNGPVEQGETLRLILIPPEVNMALRVLAVLLLAALAVRLADISIRRSLRPAAGAGQGPGPGSAAGVLFAPLLAGLLLASYPPTGHAELPSQQMLDELRERLLAPPDCAPACAQIPRMSMTVSADRIVMRIEVHASAGVAVPLPGPVFPWTASQVLIDGDPAGAVSREPGGALQVKLDEGTYQITVEGPLPERERVDVALPLTPRYVEAEAQGWTVQGIHQDGLSDSQLQLIRAADEDATPTANADGGLKATALPPFVRIERTLALGLNWQVFTRLRRLSPLGQSIVLEVPLLDGESVVSENARVIDDKVLVNMGPNQSDASWESVLGVEPELTLTAASSKTWFEQWELDASPIWHVETQGIAVVHHQREGRWLPQWRPWPGESVTLTIGRPQGVAGRTLTVQGTTLKVVPGNRASDLSLRLNYVSSQGGQHDIVIPPGSRLTGVNIDGKAQPVRSESGTVTLPLTPGAHVAELTWRHTQALESTLTTPLVDLGTKSVNASIEIEVPRDRWVLFVGGPQVGPAVLIWGVLLVIAAIAVGLGRSGRTPLRWWQWLLLGIGLSQIPIWLSIVVVGWLFALDLRGRTDPISVPKWKFNFVQIALVLLSLIALGLLFYAVQQGLLGRPEMQVAGNGSSGWRLRWFEDRIGNELPQAWFFSAPILSYRLVMLAWALWLALSLVSWLRWGWRCFASGGYWRALNFRKGRTVATGDTPAA